MTEITQADRDAASPFMPYLVLAISETSFAYAFARHREAERAKIVAFAADWMGDIEFAQFKHAIEAGEHLK